MATQAIRRGRSRALPLLALTIAFLTAGSCSDITGSSGSNGVRILWRASLAGVDRGLHSPATDGERLYSLQGQVFAHDTRTGAVVWSARYPRYMPRRLVHSAGRVFVAETAVLAFEATTGRELWRTAVDSSADFSRSAADDRAFYTGTRSHRVYALDISDGQVLWSVNIGPTWQFGGIVGGIAVKGDTVYAAANRPLAPNGYVGTAWIVALDRRSGQILWSYENGMGDDLRSFVSAPVVAGRVVIASDLMGNAVVAIDRFTGREVWRVTGEHGYIGFVDSPVVIGDTVYAASGDTHVYAIELQTGRVLWRSRTAAANNALAVCRDQVFVNHQGLSVLNRHTGALEATKFGSNNEFITSGFTVSDDRVFVLGNKAVYALSCK